MPEDFGCGRRAKIFIRNWEPPKFRCILYALQGLHIRTSRHSLECSEDEVFSKHCADFYASGVMLRSSGGLGVFRELRGEYCAAIIRMLSCALRAGAHKACKRPDLLSGRGPCYRERLSDALCGGSPRQMPFRGAPTAPHYWKALLQSRLMAVFMPIEKLRTKPRVPAL